MKTRILSLLCAAALLLSLCACGALKKDGPSTTAADDTSGSPQETTAESASGTSAVDVSAWTWADGELDCYGYGTGGVDCYLSFRYPAHFSTAEENDSGAQYRGYFFNPDDPEANANSSPYGVYVYFSQGAFGPSRASIEENVEGGFTERELGGRTVLFGKLPPDENTGSCAFAYYTPYSEDEYARIWIILCEPEENGAFRQTFEQSMNFSK